MQPSRLPSITTNSSTAEMWNNGATLAEDEVQDTASLGARGVVQDTGTMWRLVRTAIVEQLSNVRPFGRRI